MYRLWLGSILWLLFHSITAVPPNQRVVEKAESILSPSMAQLEQPGQSNSESIGRLKLMWDVLNAQTPKAMKDMFDAWATEATKDGIKNPPILMTGRAPPSEIPPLDSEGLPIDQCAEDCEYIWLSPMINDVGAKDRCYQKLCDVGPPQSSWRQEWETAHSMGIKKCTKEVSYGELFIN